MSRGRIFAAAAACLIVVGAVAAAALLSGHRLQVGVILPLTGPDAAVGLGMRNAIRLATGEVNARGGIQGRKVELVELDDASLPAKAEPAARRLADDPQISAALVHYDPDCAMVTKPIFEHGALPNILAGVSTRESGEITPTPEFRLIQFLPAQMAQAAKYAWEILGARTFIYVRDDSNLGAAMVAHFRGALTPYFKQVVTGEERVSRGDRDFSALVAKIKAAAPQYVFFGGRPLEAGLLLSQLRAAGVTASFQSATHYPSPEFVDVAGAQAEGALAVFHGLPPEETPGGQAFLAAYAAKPYPEPPGPYGIYAYAEAQALLTAMDRSFLTRPSITGALRNEGFDTALGPVRFFFIGSTYQTVAIYQVIHGRWTPIYATDKSNQLKALVAK